MNFDWQNIRARFEMGESPGQISKSLGGHPSRQAIHKRAKKDGWQVYEPVNEPDDEVNSIRALVESGHWGKCTPENKARIVKALRNGATYRVAAASIGISDRTLREWRDRDANFAGLCDGARALDISEDLQMLKRASKVDPNIAKFRVQHHPLTRDEYAPERHPLMMGNQFNVLAHVNLGIERSSSKHDPEGKLIEQEPVSD